MKNFFITAIASILLLFGVAHAEDTGDIHTQLTSNPGGIGGIESLRGASELEATRPSDAFKRFPKDHV